MSDVWLAVLVVGAATILFKAAGPVFLGRRPLPPRVAAIVALLAPVMLIALVATQTFGSGQSITVDARIPGVLAGAFALWRGVPLVPAMVVGAVVTAGLRLLS
jgi:branched-subunit amino acid transport protein